MPDGAPPIIDFSIIGDLPEIYRKGQQRAAQEQALAQFAQNGTQFDAPTRALIAANPQLGISLAQLATANARDQRDFAFRQQESQRSQGNADRSFGLQEKTTNATLEGNRVPAGFRPNAAGGLAPIPGGPMDPEYIRTSTEAKDKGKQFNANEISKLVEDGGKFSNLANFSNTFQDRFAGYKLPAAGNAAMALGRYAPGVAPQDAVDGAQWWQGYDRYKNVVRNELFGAALTANEQAAFERADIGPGMDPTTIRANLAQQTKILQDAMKRKAGALVSGGYSPEPIAKAYGLKLEDLGVDTTRRGAHPLPKISGADVEAIRANPQKTLQDAKAALAKGMDRAAVEDRLRRVGINPALLDQEAQ